MAKQAGATAEEATASVGITQSEDERQVAHRKAESAVDYYKRELEAAELGAANAKEKAAKYQQAADDVAASVAPMEAAVEESRQRLADAEAALATTEGEY